MSEKKIKMSFGLQEHHIKRINDERARWNQPDKDIQGTPPDAILIEGFWDQLGREFGWAPFTLALHYMKAERRIDNNTDYRSLWDYVHFNHNLKLLESEVGDLVHFVHKFHPKVQHGAMWIRATERLPGLNKPVRWKRIGFEEDKQLHALSKLTGVLGDLTDWEWYDESAEQPAVWIPATKRPEYNVGVLVFIPGEDNHITSGMWDAENTWVLLDEYRVPEEEVTHWMPLPGLPEGYEHDKITDEWVRELKAIAKEELGKRPPNPEQPVSELEFVEWALREGWKTSHDDKGWMKHSDETPYVLTTKELYEQFKGRSIEWSGEKEKPKEAVVIHNNSDAFHYWVSDIKGYHFALLGHSTGVWLPPGITLEMFEGEWDAYEKANNPAKKEGKS